MNRKVKISLSLFVGLCSLGVGGLFVYYKFSKDDVLESESNNQDDRQNGNLEGSGLLSEQEMDKSQSSAGSQGQATIKNPESIVETHSPDPETGNINILVESQGQLSAKAHKNLMDEQNLPEVEPFPLMKQLIEKYLKTAFMTGKATSTEELRALADLKMLISKCNKSEELLSLMKLIPVNLVWLSPDWDLTIRDELTINLFTEIHKRLYEIYNWAPDALRFTIDSKERDAQRLLINNDKEKEEVYDFSLVLQRATAEKTLKELNSSYDANLAKADDKEAFIADWQKQVSELKLLIDGIRNEQMMRSF